MLSSSARLWLAVTCLLCASTYLGVVGDHRHRHCNDKPLEDREEEANVIFTGTIRNVYPDWDHPRLKKVQVEVKRVMKGNNVISSLPGSWPGNFWHRRVITVDGIGDPQICDSRVRKYDTRIFLLAKGENGELKLNSSLIRITLDNIEHADAAVKGLPYAHKHKIETAPCSSEYCAFGAECFLDKVSQKASCRCVEKCSRVFAPVCGTDDVTYSSECHLRKTSCTQQSRINVAFQGSCETKDPCSGRKCPFGASCVPSLDGRTADCQCPTQCASYGDSEGSRPVCGSDGRDYASVCDMRRRACRQMKEVRVKYLGKCDPCKTFDCPTSQSCQLDEAREPVCRCDLICNLNFEPVCGSDGHTYANECIMRESACKARTEVRVIFKGECSAGKNPCTKLSCAEGESCHVNHEGRAHCACPPPCERIVNPVCGTDGRSYDSECALKRTACLTKQRLTVRFHRECSNDGPCSKHKCQYGAVCVIQNKQATCECPICQDNLKPVCGSDGVSYDNGCKLQAENCRRHTNITVKHMGRCNDCARMKCDHYAICEGDEKTGTRCVCPKSCVQVEKKVCGSDGVTYMNECELQVRSCRNKQTITVASHGACGLCADVKCRFGARCVDGKCTCPDACPSTGRAVCGDDGTTYDSECHLLRQACLASVDIDVAHHGSCDEFSGSGDDGSAAGIGGGGGGGDGECDDSNCRFGGTCKGNTCVCNFMCDAVRSPVCGSDGKTHGSSCLMMEEACRTQQPISEQTMDNCEDITEELCDGSQPMTNPLTGQHYSCSLGRDTCPAGSYCHTVGSTSKCCKQDQLIRSCSETKHGCCPDGKTSAPGPAGRGCPGICHCNPLGSYGLTCNPQNHQCTCKPGVGGLRCDRCEPGFWGLHRIAEGNTGCIPCGCDLHGSVRDDCEQTAGSCVCKEGVIGLKCDQCVNGKSPATGCRGGNSASTKTCRDVKCHYGATCQMNDGVAECVCTGECRDGERSGRVCGMDGKTYASLCQMELFGCRLQKKIRLAYKGSCKADLTAKPTESIDMSYGQMGDFCEHNEDCVMPHAVCRYSLCSCDGGYVLSRDRSSCEDASRTYETPGFNGDSYLRLKTINHANRQIEIEFEFRVLNSEAILFYSAQHETEQGDFISLSVKDGYVEFRFDLGSGPITLRSEQVTLNTFHKVVAKRTGRQGSLAVDDARPVVGVSQGTLQSLNLAQPFYLGGVPKMSAETKQNLGIESGLVGCIKNLVITTTDGPITYDLVYPRSKDVMEASMIDECGHNACSRRPCKNNGHCKYFGSTPTCLCKQGYSGSRCEHGSSRSSVADPCNPNPCEEGGRCTAMPSGGHFVCHCPEGRQGRRCEQEFSGEIKVPSFDGNSYLQLSIMGKVATTLNYQLWFLATEPNGVLLYSYQPPASRDGRIGDFVSLNLVDGHLQFRYDLGSGIANITSDHPVSLNTWHEVEITRSQRQGTLVIDGGKPVRGTSQGVLRNLNLSPSIYVGGYPGDPKPSSGITGGFNGAIQRVYESHHLIEPLVSGAISSNGLREHRGAPCYTPQNVCLNGGECTPHLNDYMCKCRKGFSGKNCKRVGGSMSSRMDGPVAFNGRVYYQYMNKITKKHPGQKSNQFEVRFRTRSPDGLLLLQRKSDNLLGDYLAIALRGGRAEVTYNLGKESSRDLLTIRSDIRLNDGNWHAITFNREKRKGTLFVDNKPAVSRVSQQGATSLDTDGYLWLGGSRSVPKGLPDAYYKPFDGCIKSLVVDKENVDLVENRVNPTRIEFCDS